MNNYLKHIKKLSYSESKNKDISRFKMSKNHPIKFHSRQREGVSTTNGQKNAIYPDKK